MSDGNLIISSIKLLTK